PINLDRITIQTPNTDIIVKDVDAAELGDRGIDERRAVTFVAYISCHAFSVEPFFAQKFTRALEGSHTSIGQHQLCTLPGKKNRCCPTIADTLALRLPRSCDESNLSF